MGEPVADAPAEPLRLEVGPDDALIAYRHSPDGAAHQNSLGGALVGESNGAAPEPEAPAGPALLQIAETDAAVVYRRGSGEDDAGFMLKGVGPAHFAEVCLAMWGLCPDAMRAQLAQAMGEILVGRAELPPFPRQLREQVYGKPSNLVLAAPTPLRRVRR